jgi:hypothetical protein
MKSDNNPKAADISALKEIIAGTPADDSDHQAIDGL